MRLPIAYDCESEELCDNDGECIGNAEPASGPSIATAVNCHADLLEACKAAVVLLDSMCGSWPGTIPITARNLRSKLVAAITKAEGDQPKQPTIYNVYILDPAGESNYLLYSGPDFDIANHASNEANERGLTTIIKELRR